MHQVERLHKHIDNGGITVEVNYDFDNGHTNIKFDTSYFGYPNVSATLSTWGQPNDEDFLKEVGLMFLRASETVKSLIKEQLQE